MKIGILTYHRARNYGAFLQAVCLCKRLNEEVDIEAEIIDYDSLSAQKHYSYRYWKIIKKILKFQDYRFVKKQSAAFQRGILKLDNLITKEHVFSDDIKDFQEFVKDKYDVIIAGSDEIWKIKGFRPFLNPYFLPGNLGCRKLSYAASARMDFDSLSENNHKILHDCLNDFEFISVRDRLTFTSVNAEGIEFSKLMISCDPSFLYDFNENDEDLNEILSAKCKLDRNKKVVVLASVNKKIAKKIIQDLSDSFNIVSTYTRIPGCINVADLDPFEWRKIIANADFVITCLFHGVCFSIVNKTPFLAISENSKKAKLQGILCGTDLENRLLDSKTASTMNWKSAVKLFGNVVGFEDFVKKQRSNFGLYLNALRGNQVGEELNRLNQEEIIKHPSTYAVKHINEDVRANSRSGGVFTALSDNILEKGGVVYGCVLDEKLNAVHVRATSKNERDLMRGSKYVQSSLGNTFYSVKKDLQDDKWVLFSGTSCQVDGLKHYLGKDYSKLILVDILCRGVPGRKVWSKYINWLENKYGKCTMVAFRDKKNFGWKAHVESLYFNGKKINSTIYTSLFTKGYSLRPSCYECQYKREWHPGDLTLGDYWEINNVLPTFNDNKGVSLVMVNTEKGETIFEQVKEKLICHKTKYEYSVRDSMLIPAEKPLNRKQFWDDLENKSFSYIAKKYGNNGFIDRIKGRIHRFLKRCKIR